MVFTGLVGWWLWRILQRRAERAAQLQLRTPETEARKELRESGLLEEEEQKAMDAQRRRVDPVQAAIGAAGAWAISYGLYSFALTIDSTFQEQALSDTYSVRQITVTIRTIVSGLVYLAAFIYGANAVGLTGLALQTFARGSDGGDGGDGGEEEAATGPVGPTVAAAKAQEMAAADKDN